jgi:hypothetical protein
VNRISRIGPGPGWWLAGLLLVAGVPRAIDAQEVTAPAQASIRAIRVTEPLRIDGILAESVYAAVEPIRAFIQNDPDRGAPATERTEAWVLFNEQFLYVVARCWDADPDGPIANEMRRDGEQLRRNDSFGVLLDTFHDRRNAFLFYVNPLGGLADELITDERTPNTDWNTVWDARTARFEGGWTVEIAIPFASLRYAPGAAQTWGINLRRIIRRKNEYVYTARMPAVASPLTAIFRVSAANTLEGLETPSRGRGLEVKPYGLVDVTTDYRADPPEVNDPDARAGVDVKLGLSEGLTADVTVNTDFAQVEVDEQQVNLTRFNLVFPEKREFFLEGRGLFDFGGARGGDTRTGDTPVIFFSRRIGLSEVGEVPVRLGGRVTGRTGAYLIGLLNVQTGDDDERSGEPSTNFSVVRIKRDILERSAVGLIVTNRSHVEEIGGTNQAVGVDALLSFYENLNINAYVAGTRTTEVGNGLSYRAQLDYNGDRYGLQVERLLVGDRFRPEVGFLRREEFARSFVSGRVSRRPASEAIRRVSGIAQFDYVTDPGGRLETRELQATFDVELENSDRATARYARIDDVLTDPFEISDGIVLPPGDYEFQDVRVTYAMGPQRPVSASVSVQAGTFYTGTITALGVEQGRIAVTPRLSVEPSLLLNWVDLDEGSFQTTVARVRASYSITPRMFVTGLVQYNSEADSVGTNLRLRWEYQPGSELFVVYTDERTTEPEARSSALTNRAVAVKVTRLLRF